MILRSMIPWNRVSWLALTILAGFPPPGNAGDPPPDRVQQLEEDLASLRKEFEAYRAANPPRPASSPEQLTQEVQTYLSEQGPALPDAPRSRGVRLGGYTTFSWLDPRDEPARFDLDRLVFTVSGSVSDGIDFLTEIEFEGGGITDEFDGEIAIEQAMVTFHLSELFNPKFGWLLIPFGRYNLYHDDPLNDFTVRPFTARYLVPTGFGQPGIGMTGSVTLQRSGHVLTYDVVLTNGFRDAFTADEGTREARQNGENNDGKQVWGRFAALLETGVLDHLEIGLSGTYGVYDDDDDDAVSGYAIDFLIRKGPFECKGEWIVYDIGRSATDPLGAVTGQSGLWLEAGWHFFPPRWRRNIRGLVTETSTFVLAVRYQLMDLDDGVTGATVEDDLQAFSLGFDYRLTERTVFRLDYTWYFAELGSDWGELAFSVSTYF